MDAAIVLASASPRRSALLSEAGLRFRLAPVDVDEVLDGWADATAAARGLALRKARAAALPLGGRARWVVGADTVVAALAQGRERLLGKPENEDEAASMLATLSGTRHAVVTGVAVVRCRDGSEWVDSERTGVTMRPLSAREVADYVASGEWRGKAGGYAIQESADAFVTSLEGGGWDNVVGLPVGLTLGLLERAGAPGLPPRG